MNAPSEPPAALKAAVVTYGCKVNQCESAAMASSLAEAGYRSAEASEASLVVVNTCAVTGRAAAEARRLIRRLKRSRPALLVVATGCLAQLEPESLSGPDMADLVLGQARQAELASIARDLKPGAAASLVSEAPKTLRDLGTPPLTRTRAFHKIQDGCSARCAYCAVPLARGRSRSLALERVLSGLAARLDEGVREIVLTGVHLGHWGLDLDPPSSLAALLAAIDKRLADKLASARLRLSSLEPLEIPLAAPALKEGRWLVPHLHAPLQSGSDRVLALMGRPYQASEALAILRDLKSAIPDLSVGADILCGFPSETEDDFRQTLDLVERAPLSRLHVFPFSPRPGTRAASLPGPVPEPVKRERAAVLRAMAARKAADFLDSQRGLIREALVESRIGPDGRIEALTDNYLRVLLPKQSQVAVGQLVQVRIMGPADSPSYAEGVLASEDSEGLASAAPEEIASADPQGAASADPKMAAP